VSIRRKRDWQQQKSYRKAQARAVQRLREDYGAEVFGFELRVPTYPLIKWSGIPAKIRGGITGGEYLW